MATAEQVNKTLEIAEKFYGTVSDPDQIPITEESLRKLVSIHPDLLKIKTDDDGEPISWVVGLPTSRADMELFLADQITERELFDRAVRVKNFEALYLCSAFTLPEYRRQGLAETLMVEMVQEITSDPKQVLYCWVYSPEGEALVQAAKKYGRELKVKL